MNRIEELIARFNMQAHPEGGFYAETYRSGEEVETEKGTRSLMTVIYFLLRSEDKSRFHVIESDELWFHHEGADLSIHVLDDSGYKILKLGKNDEAAAPQQLVSRRKIFGSTVDEPNSYALVSCVVSPGFDFQDFRLLGKKELLELYPSEVEIIDFLGVQD